MQQADNQHLDFLISQYVDGTLEGSGKKSVEQKMLIEPEARALYADHRETQDILDDWGNRLPMIDWNAFDSKLAARLDEEAKEQERVSIFRRRMKPVAAAAALLIAASLGYAWHALSAGGHTTNTPIAEARGAAQATRNFAVLVEGSGTKPSSAGLTVDEPAAAGLARGVASDPEITPPENAMALESLQDSVQIGLKNVKDLAPIQIQTVPSAVVVDQYGIQKDEKDQQLPR